MLKTTKTILSLVLMGAMGQAAAQANDPVVNTLTEQGRFWESRGDFEKAADAWSKLLRLQASNPEALAGMGLAELQAGRNASASQYLNQLRNTGYKGPLLGKLERALNAGSVQAATPLEQARALARSRQYDEAVRFYREHFGNTRPTGLLALEYYQTLGATPQGWEEARRELESLSRGAPNDDRFALAYGQHLSYREPSRRQSIQILSALADSPSVGVQARQAWRQALIWLEARPADQNLYTAYLNRNPSDPQVAERLQSMQVQRAGQAPTAAVRDPVLERQARVGQLLETGFAQLEAGNLPAAERQFQQILSLESANKDALGGLGVVRLRQERFQDAENLLDRANRAERDGRWAQALNAATVGKLAMQANSALQSGDRSTAKARYEQMAKVPGGQRRASQGLAQLAYEAGDYRTAEAQYRQLLAVQADDQDARVGLVLALIGQGRSDEAQRLIDEAPAGTAQQADNLRAAIAYEAARKDLAAGNNASAMRNLEDTIAYNPAYPWARVELARLYRAQGRVAEARALVDPLVSAVDAPDESLYAAALYYSELGDNTAASSTLARIPASELSSDQKQLAQRTEFLSTVDQAQTLGRLGRTDDARRLASSLEAQAELQPALLLNLASLYADLGDTASSLRLTQRYRSQTNLSALSVDESVQYGFVLLKNNQTAELQALLRRLQSTGLNPQQAMQVADLNKAIALKQSDGFRSQNDLASAYDALAPSLAQAPNDPDLTAALARLYTTGNQPAEALRLYSLALQGKPNDPDILTAGLGAAAAAQDFRTGQDFATRLERARPRDPVALADIGRFYRAAGDTDRAQSYFQAALAEEIKLTGTSQAFNPDASRTAPGILSPGFAADQLNQGRVPPNPFRNSGAGANVRPASQTQQPGFAAPANLGVAQQPAGNPPAFIPPAMQPSLPPPAIVPGAERPFPNNAPTRAIPPTNTQFSPGVSAGSDRISQLQNELKALAPKFESFAHGGPFVRSREGESGLSELTEVAVPIEYRRSIWGGTGAVSIKPIVVDAGDVENNFSTLTRFGGGPVASLNNLNSPVTGIGSQSMSSAVLKASYASDILRFDIANRPTNIGRTDASAGLNFVIPLSPAYTVNLEASRRPVTDSFLSYVGAKDARAGLGWGAVSATGGRVGLTREVDGFGTYGYAGMYQYDGANVADNTKREFGVGTYFRLINEADERLTVGAGLNYFGFSDNLSYYTFGHGGYFSPQSYVSAVIPVEYWRQKSRLSYGVSGSAGYQTFREDSNVYFPTSATLQARAQEAFDEIGLLGLSAGLFGPVYQGQSVRGFSYNLAGAVEYQLNQSLVLGGLIGMDNASNFRQFKVGLYMRMQLDEEVAQAKAPPLVPDPFAN